MQKHIVMNVVRDHQGLMIKEAKSIEKKIETLQADRDRLWREIQSMTCLIEKLDAMPNHVSAD